jgi:hypothetical protein
VGPRPFIEKRRKGQNFLPFDKITGFCTFLNFSISYTQIGALIDMAMDSYGYGEAISELTKGLIKYRLRYESSKRTTFGKSNEPYSCLRYVIISNFPKLVRRSFFKAVSCPTFLSHFFVPLNGYISYVNGYKGSFQKKYVTVSFALSSQSSVFSLIFRLSQTITRWQSWKNQSTTQPPSSIVPIVTLFFIISSFSNAGTWAK